MRYTDADVERVAEAICNADTTSWKNTDNTQTLPDVTWAEMRDGTDHIPYEGISLGRDHYRGMARAALEAMEREPLVHGDLLDRLTRVAEAGFHWWEAWADEGGYDGEYKHMDREQRIDHILCHDLLLALDALAPDYFDGLTGKPKYAVAAAKGGE